MGAPCSASHLLDGRVGRGFNILVTVVLKEDVLVDLAGGFMSPSSSPPARSLSAEPQNALEPASKTKPAPSAVQSEYQLILKKLL